MKKIIFLIVIISSVSFSSCRKCANCSYTYTDEYGVEYSYSYDEYCNTKKDVENFEIMVKNQAEDLGGTHDCDIE
ncbi:MAG TPA: hypothetical protein DDX39_02250 [Bacteroidales bacterium]|nr:MAG: hypothetical protein A2W98_08870 [Bacteroidetes bacterium GWF2_33_38]OFY75406.1 MAG: hypothetical protein A2265_05635 [Bacteroidetes bacterium RIFOXYA12_FULL_33_9]OFY84979.1 MAG: hypothetical protein A2236_03155 [Bacteroidetes bacterium RIFOXYA2_FULL_33_7]HBF87436.1 hypothetical protein [Bacteroidales bacterium]